MTASYTVDGWTITEEDDRDDDCIKRSFFAARDGARHEIDVSPYTRDLSTSFIRAMIALGFPTRADFGSACPLREDEVLARYWRQRAEQVEGRVAYLESMILTVEASLAALEAA